MVYTRNTAMPQSGTYSKRRSPSRSYPDAGFSHPEQIACPLARGRIPTSTTRFPLAVAQRASV
jgi:hypothetical protein